MRSFVIIGLLCLGFYFIFKASMDLSTQRELSAQGGAVELSSQFTPQQWTSQQLDAVIDRQLKAGRLSEELNSEKMKIENELQVVRPDLQRLDPLVRTNEKSPLPIQIQPESPWDVSNDNKDLLRQKYHTLTPEQRIVRKLNRDQFALDLEKQREDAFLQQFIQNARQAGYEVKLNAKGEIVSVTDRGTSEPLRFPQSVKEPGEED